MLRLRKHRCFIILLLLLTVLLDGSGALARTVSTESVRLTGLLKVDNTNVSGDDETDAYTGTGGLLLPSNYSGTASSRHTIANCLDCFWKYTIYCAKGVVGLCAHAVTTCAPGQIRYRVWFGHSPTSLQIVGSVCAGYTRPATRRQIEKTIQDSAIRYVPELAPKISPPRRTLTTLPIYAYSGQQQRFSPAPMNLAGHQVRLTAQATWLWDWGDGTRLWTNQSGSLRPDSGISHTYRRAGQFKIVVRTLWQAKYTVLGIGTFTASGEAVTQQKTLSIRVLATRGVLVSHL
ncbi:MAG: hypothetical protein EBS36_05950 [Actinobacteria bacterium]|nr:hypothetical protein [Actinomycetota bacterium]NBY15037.1 hypothetical protein [Actinomycetota bacterium]